MPRTGRLAVLSPSFPGNNPSALVGEVQLGNVWVHTALKGCGPVVRIFVKNLHRHSDRHLHHRISPYSVTGHRPAFQSAQHCLWTHIPITHPVCIDTAAADEGILII